MSLEKAIKHDNDREYKLCYIANHIMYFTDNFANQWGDDWNDAPYECNAGEPYELADGVIGDNRGHMRYLAYKQDCCDYDDVVTPSEIVNNYYGCRYSVADINSGAAAWLYNRTKKSALMPGTSIGDAIKWCKENNLKVGELT